MADRGAQVAVDATSYDADAFQHVQDSIASFPEATAAAADQSPADVNSWVDVVDPLTDWGDQYATARGGDGWYMTEAVTTDKKLQGAPSGSSQASGTVQLTLGMSATVAATSTVSSAAMAKAVALQGSSNGGSTTSQLSLKNTKNLVGQADGAATLGPTRHFGLLRDYDSVILGDAPVIYARFEEGSGTPFYNHASLGGAQVGTLNQDGRYANTSLVETTVGKALRNMGLDFGSYFSSHAPSRAFTVEWWAMTQDYGPNNLFAAATQTTVPLRVNLNPDGTLHVERGNTSDPSTMTLTDDAAKVAFDIPIVVDDHLPHYMAFSCDDQGVTAVIDGQAFSVAAAAPTDTSRFTWSSYPRMNAKGGGVGQYTYTWYLDDVAYSDKALTVDRLQAHYAAGLFDPPWLGASGGHAIATADLGYLGKSLDLGTGQTDGRSTTTADLTLPPFLATSAGQATATATITVTSQFNITSDYPPRLVRSRFYS